MEQTLTRPLTRAQQARRQRVIDAAMALGLEGGYEAVQMRDVAARADVAMGTVYRYFTSKDHLLAATLVHWVEMLDTRIGQHPPREEHPADRVLDVLDRALRAMGRQPKLVTAVFTSLSSPDPAAVGCQQQITLLMEGIISRAMGERDVPDMSDRGPHDRPRLVLRLGRLGQRLVHHGTGLRRAVGVGPPPVAGRARRAPHTRLTCTKPPPTGCVVTAPRSS